MTGSGASRGAQGAPEPYVGPRPFREEDTDRFFARDAETAEARSRLQDFRVVVLHGPAAVGKTSLVQAGLRPMLTREGATEVVVSGRLARRHLPSPDQQAGNGYSLALLRSWGALEPGGGGTAIAGFLTSRLERAVDGEPRRIVAAIDQFEELFTDFPSRQAEREEFIDQLVEALRQVPALRLLLIVRDDCLAALRTYEQRLSPDGFGLLPLAALDAGAARSAVTLPLMGTGRSFDAPAAEELVTRLRRVTYMDMSGASATLVQDRVAPLFLQIVCAELWSALPAETDTITSDDVRRFGDPDKALARFYDATIRGVGLETGFPEDGLRTWVESTFITEHGTRGTANQGIRTTAGVPNEVAAAFAERHLLAAEHRGASTWYQLIHDRLIVPVQEANRAVRAPHGTQPPGQVPEPATPAAFAAAAQAALARGDLPSAGRFASLAAAGYRESGDDRRLAHALALRGDIARSEEDLSGARECFRAALSAFTMLGDRNSTVRMLSALADIHFSAGDYRTAADLQRQAVGRLPTDVSALTGLGYAQWYDGSPADAEATFTQAISGSRRAARAFAGRGQVRADMQEYTAALEDLDDALASGVPQADETDARSARALALAALGLGEEAATELAAARRNDPSRALTLLRAGKIAAMAGQPELAHSEFERALRAWPPLPAREQAAARRLLATLEGSGAR